MTEAEKTIIACAMQWPDQSLPFLTEAGIRPDSFAAKPAQTLFRHIVAAWLEKRPCDAVATITGLGNEVGSAGGANAILELSTFPAIPSTLGHYADALKSASAKRRLHKCLKEGLAALDASSVQEVMAGLEAEMGDISAMRESKRTPTAKALVMGVVAKLEARADGTMAGLSTGIATLDAETGGIRPDAYWVVAGPTKGGKSALVRYMVRSVAIEQGKPVLLFGLEMSNEDTVEALLATTGRVSASRMRDGKMSDTDYAGLARAAEAIAKAPIYFRDDVYDLSGIRSYTRQVKAINPELSVVVVDYLQLSESGGKMDTREQEIAAISKGLRRMAKDENVAVIALAQLNDDGELRECRAIGMDATVQVTIETTDQPGKRNLRLRQRQGRTGVGVPVAFLGDTFEWHPLAEEEPDQPKPKKRRWND